MSSIPRPWHLETPPTSRWSRERVERDSRGRDQGRGARGELYALQRERVGGFRERVTNRRRCSGVPILSLYYYSPARDDDNGGKKEFAESSEWGNGGGVERTQGCISFVGVRGERTYAHW